jgi:hypothetical protein
MISSPTPTATSDSISAFVTSCSDVAGCVRHFSIFSRKRQAGVEEQRLVAVLEVIRNFV